MKPIKLLFICLLFVGNAFGQVNLIDTLRLDTLGSNCLFSAETSNKYVFNSNYGAQNQIYSQSPYKGNSIISIDKFSMQKTIKYHLNSGDTSWYINYLFQKNDTIHTIENAIYIDSACSCKTVRILSNRYDESLNLIKSNTLDVIKNDTATFAHSFLIAHNENHVCLSTEKIINNSSKAIFWIVDIKTDSVIISRSNLTNFSNPFRLEKLYYISANEYEDFIISGIGLGSNSMNGSQIVKLYANNNYSSEVIYSSHGYSEPNYEAYFVWAQNYVIEKNNTYYSTAQGNCIQDSTSLVNGYVSSCLTFLKSHKFDSTLIAYKGVCAPMDSTPIGAGGIFDVQLPTAMNPIKFINDHIFLDIHPTHMDLNSFFYSPCQPFSGRMEIVYWDTSLSVVKRTWISNPNENFFINGFYETQQKNLMIYGYMCRYNHPLDSIQLFAFLLDQNSGHLLNIFNANDFQVENMISIHPNPFTNQLLINKTFAQEADLLLYDGLGKLVVHQKIKENSSVISTEDLPNGLYFYSFINAKGERLQVGKLLKE